MATGMLSPKNKRSVILKELKIGLTNGFFFGFVGGGVVFLINYLGVYNFGSNPLEIASIVSIGLVSSCITATVLGVFFPLFFARLGIDPAIASGPIITAVNDVCSTVIYFLVVYVATTIFFV